jgi:hypothetical protein
LERRADGDDGQALRYPVEDLKVIAHHDVGFAAEQKLHAVNLRSAHLDRDIEPGLIVKAGGFGLIKAAVLGLRVPAGEKRHLVGCFRRAERKQERCSGSHAGSAGSRHGVSCHCCGCFRQRQLQAMHDAGQHCS